MRKTYQNEEIDTSQPAVPDTVIVVLAETASDIGSVAASRMRRTYHADSALAAESS